MRDPVPAWIATPCTFRRGHICATPFDDVPLKLVQVRAAVGTTVREHLHRRTVETTSHEAVADECRHHALDVGLGESGFPCDGRDTGKARAILVRVVREREEHEPFRALHASGVVEDNAHPLDAHEMLAVFGACGSGTMRATSQGKKRPGLLHGRRGVSRLERV